MGQGTDCDDNDASTVNDMDCDGVVTSEDCDDGDSSSPYGEKINRVDYLGSDSFINAFNECEYIILLGMASKEGVQKYEEQRAYTRGIQLSVWLRSLINENPHIHLLNIGQYQGPKNVDTSIQISSHKIYTTPCGAS